MLKAKVNEAHDFLIEKVKGQYIINGSENIFDIQKINEVEFHIIHKHKSYQVTILRHDLQKKMLEIQVNGVIHKVAMQDKNELLLEKMGILKKEKKEIKVLRAPMPGLIVEIKVKEGQSVKKDQPLIILKAMKMENILRSPTNGSIKKILVKSNQKIEKEAVIIQF